MIINNERRYDIDALRVIAIGLLLIYHIAIVFQPWGIFIGFIQSKDSLENLWIIMSMINVWRIPLLFFVSGMGISFAIAKRNWKQLISERAKRILLPLIFGAFCIVPMHQFIFQKFYQKELFYFPNAGHLWFLGNIFIYVIILTPLIFYLKNNVNGKIIKFMKKVFGNPFTLLPFVAVPFILEVLIIKPETYEMYVNTIHGFLLGLLAFLFGFCFNISGNSFAETVHKWRGLFLVIAFALFLLRVILFNFKAPNTMIAMESLNWIFAVFGFAYKALNHPGKMLSYLSQSAYPVYIIHMIILYISCWFILPMAIPTILKFIAIVMSTFTGCFVLYELIIRRINFIRPLFGLKKKETQKF